MDCCCYNRPFDDLTQGRIRVESGIIMWILNECQSGNYELIGSVALEAEISRISNLEKRGNVLNIYSLTSNFVNLDWEIKQRAEEIRGISNIQTFDSYHIASAEMAHADVMLTTDIKLIKMATRLQLKVDVMNPTTFMSRYIYGGE